MQEVGLMPTQVKSIVFSETTYTVLQFWEKAELPCLTAPRGQFLLSKMLSRLNQQNTIWVGLWYKNWFGCGLIYGHCAFFLKCIQVSSILYQPGYIKYILVSILHVWVYMNYLSLIEEYTFWFCSVGGPNYKFLLFYHRHAISRLLLVLLNLKCETRNAK